MARTQCNIFKVADDMTVVSVTIKNSKEFILPSGWGYTRDDAIALKLAMFEAELMQKRAMLDKLSQELH